MATFKMQCAGVVSLNGMATVLLRREDAPGSIMGDLPKAEIEFENGAIYVVTIVKETAPDGIRHLP